MKKYLLKFFYGISIPDGPSACIPTGIHHSVGHEFIKIRKQKR